VSFHCADGKILSGASIQEAFAHVINSHSSAQFAFDVGAPLREIWDCSLEEKQNTTDKYYRKLQSSRVGRKLDRENSEITDRRMAVPRSYYPKIVAEYEK